MPAISKDEAVELLAKEIERFEADELGEVYEELFRYALPTPQAMPKDSALQVEQIVAFLNGDLDPGEVEEVWSMVFPPGRRVSYDDEDGLYHFRDHREPTYAEW